MFIINHRSLFLGFAACIFFLALGLLAVFGLKPGIEFTGGSLVEASFGVRPDKGVFSEFLDEEIAAPYSLRLSGEQGYIIRSAALSPDALASLTEAIESQGGTVSRTAVIGPTFGQEVKMKGFWALSGVVVVVILYVWFAFRNVSRPVPSWMYGLIVLAALGHDLIVPLGAFALLGALGGVEVDTMFLTALLVILGYSINDTIVVFDRVREHLRVNEKEGYAEPFRETVGHALSEMFARSVNTSLTTLLAIGAVYVFGSASTKLFALALMLGVVAGTYSSLFFAAPMLVFVAERRKEEKAE